MTSHSILDRLANNKEVFPHIFTHETLIQPMSVPTGLRCSLPADAPNSISILEMMAWMNPLRIPVIGIPNDVFYDIPQFSGAVWGNTPLPPVKPSVRIVANTLHVPTGWRSIHSSNAMPVLEFLFRLDLVRQLIAAINAKIFEDIVGKRHPDDKRLDGKGKGLSYNMLYDVLASILNAVIVADKNGHRIVRDMLDSEVVPLITHPRISTNENTATLLVGDFSRSVCVFQAWGLTVFREHNTGQYRVSIKLGVDFYNRDIIHMHNIAVR